MNALDVAVLVAAGAGIAAVLWYFLFQRTPAAEAMAGAGGVQEVVIAVEGGYAPSTIRVRRGTPVRLVFERRETASCSEEVVLPDFGVRRFLPAHERTVVELSAPAPGAHAFTCGMGMLRGTLIVD